MSRSIRKIASFFLLTTVFLAGCDTASNTPNPAKSYFVKYYGENGFQTGVDVAVNKDGTFILFGNSGVTANLADTRLFLVKADTYGNIIWKTTFGSPDGNLARDVEITSDGGIIILANSIISSVSEVMVQKFDNATGNASGEAVILPVKNCSGQNKIAHSITELNNEEKDLIIAGSSLDSMDKPITAHTSDAIQIRIKSDLTKYTGPWTQTSGLGKSSVATKVVQLGDSIFLCGYSNGGAAHLPNDLNYSILSLTSVGDAIAPVTIPSSDEITGLPSSDEVLGSAVAQGNFIFLAGISGQSDIYVAKASINTVSYSESLIFNTKAGVNIPFVNQNPSQTSMALSSTGDFFVLTNNSATGNSDWLLAKIDGTSGLIKPGWEITTYGGAGEDISGAVKELPDGRIILFGTISIDGETKMALMKVNKIGHFAD